MKRWPVLGVALAVLWLFVRGVPIEATRIAEEALIGLGVGLPIAFVFRRFYQETIPLGRVTRALPAMVVYLVLFVWELITANIDVAYRVLSPSMPIEPRVIEIPVRVETDLGITTIANSITLTPGTLTLDYDDDRNSLLVHAIAGENTEAVVAPIRRWEDHALRIFEEEGEPHDAAPAAELAETDRQAEWIVDGESDATDEPVVEDHRNTAADSEGGDGGGA